MAKKESSPSKTEKQKVDRKAGNSRLGRTAVRLDAKEENPILADQKAKQGPKVRKSQRGEDVRKRILKGALECFGAFGFEGTSTRAVAERAGVTHTLVLYHFDSKDQLWISTMDAVLREYGEEMEQHLTKALEVSATEGLRTFIEQFIRMSAQRPQIHRIMTMESNQGTSRMEWVIENFTRKHFDEVRDVIRRGQNEGNVRQCDPARLYYTIIGAGGTPFTVSTEYKALTGRDVFSETEILRNIAFLYELVFIDPV